MNFKTITIIQTVILGIFLLNIGVNAQGTIIPLMKDGWVGGLSGSLGWDNYNINAGDENIVVDSEAKGFGFIISSRNGRFVEDNAVMGFDLQWEENHLTTLSQNNEKRLGFIGLWIRYYVPFVGWAAYSETSVGYGNYKSIEEKELYSGFSKHNAFADGFVYNVGLGATIFVSNNVAFEATGRYQGGKLKGEYEYAYESFNNLEIKLSNLDILFGIMVYLR